MISLKQLFLLNNAQTSPSPRLIEVERAAGVYLYTPENKAIMDLVSGFAVSNIGHCHPNVVQAVKEQAERYMHVSVYGELVQAPQVLFAEKLVSVLPQELNSVYFVNSGAEATEGALKLAKRYTGRSEIISCHKSYHGSTHGALSVMGNELFKQPFRPLLPDINFVEYNNIAELDRITTATAAIILEAIQGEAGIVVPSNEYMQALRKRCTETGTLIIFDEIQTGFGRTGKLFGFEHYGIIPDILLLAKGIGGGMPIGAFIAAKEIMDSLKENPILGHITTFGGHPVSCAAGLATLSVILNERLTDSIAQKEQLFRELLVHPKIHEIRGRGLMLCAQLDSFNQVETVSKRCAEKGIMVDWFLHCETAIRIAPPLIISEEQIREACKIIIETIDEVPID